MSDHLTLNQRIELALANFERPSRMDRSLDELIAPHTDESFRAAVTEAQSELGELWKAANALMLVHTDGTPVSPLAAAILESSEADVTDADVDQADAAIEAIRFLSTLQVSAYAEANARSKRGRRPSRSAAVRAVVRSVVHHLHLEGKPYKGGWSYLNRSGRPGRRTTEREIAAVGAAEIILESVRYAKLSAERAEVRGHHVEYITELGGRPPSETDYMTDYSAFASTD